MSKVHAKDTQVWIDALDVSNWLNNVSLTKSRAVAQSTGFRSTGDAHTFKSGHRTSSFTGGGSFDGDADAIDDVLDTHLRQDDPAVVTLGPNGLEVGKVAKLISALATDYTVNDPLEDVVSVDLDVQGTGETLTGVSLRSTDDTAAAAGADTNSASQDNAASSADGGIGHVHVTANSLSVTADVIVQHSTDDATWVDLATETIAIADTGGFRVTVAEGTTVNRYVRAQVSVGAGTGTITVGVAFARR